MRVLVTGVTGYVGSKLVPRLLEEGFSVRVLVRDPEPILNKPWFGGVEVFTGDVLKPETLTPAFAQVDCIYYLIHSMVNVVDYSSGDSMAALHVGRAAKAAGVKRIIYLGGLGNPDSDLSTHLRSRHITGEKLRASGVPLTEFRAGIIIGSGSASFELIRYLTERLPIIITPRWVSTRGQPIAIKDVVEYMVSALTNQKSIGEIIEIGGPRILSYADMMLSYAEIRGLRRYLVPIPILTPILTSQVGRITPVPTQIALALIEGLKNEVIVRDPIAKNLFPGIQPIDYTEAVTTALKDLSPEHHVHLSDNSPDMHETRSGISKHTNLHGMITDYRRLKVRAPPERLFRTITSLGGHNGWLFANKLWQLRGFLDEVLGGVGIRRGRNHPTEIRVGDTLDFYQVDAMIPGRMMRLKGEMKVPGEAWMEWWITPIDGSTSFITQIASFAPKGLWGQVYWYLLYPIHSIVFKGLIQRMVVESTVTDQRTDPTL